LSDYAHASVLVEEVIAHLSVRDRGSYVDATAGGGGHSEAILEAGAERVIAIDRDPDALVATRSRLARFGDRVQLVHGRFGALRDLVSEPVVGIVADLGVSSPQLDRADRGFSFAQPGPIDMRMDPTAGPTALELLHQLDVDALTAVLRDFGEERYAARIARELKTAAREDRLATTTDIAAICARAIPIAEQRRSKIHPATRTFQALRIATNRELDELARFLVAFPDLLAPGGRCVVISFHSLEDRLVKNAFRDLAWTSSLPPRLADAEGERVRPVCEVLTKKPVVATDVEVERNPRARSAKLRACERTDAPNLPATRRPSRDTDG
jgi:16S rRNA (cytosine1402-N4)-methyltransferase